MPPCLAEPDQSGMAACEAVHHHQTTQLQDVQVQLVVQAHPPCQSRVSRPSRTSISKVIGSISRSSSPMSEGCWGQRCHHQTTQLQDVQPQLEVQKQEPWKSISVRASRGSISKVTATVVSAKDMGFTSSQLVRTGAEQHARWPV